LRLEREGKTISKEIVRKYSITLRDTFINHIENGCAGNTFFLLDK
jgi:hypothetical protein